MRFHHAVRTDVGRVREHNEDTFLADPDLGLYVVADGMGGRAAGEVASRLAVQSLHDVVGQGVLALDAGVQANGATRDPGAVMRLLTEAVTSAAQTVYDASQAESGRKGMGTTLTAVLFFGREGYVAHVGDSRAYLVRGGHASQLTRDHSLIDELVVAGHLTREEASAPEMDRLRCVLARAVGVSTEVAVDVIRFETLPGDRVLLCTDGLSHYIDAPEIATFLEPGLDAAVERFVSEACDRGGHDNVTALAVGCESDDPADVDRLRSFERLSDALSRVPLFHRLDSRELLHVLLATETVHADAGEVLLRAEQPLPALHVVLDGRVELTRNGAAPEEAGPGDSFGETALVDRWTSAPTVTATEASSLARLTRESLIAVSRREPEIAPKIVYAFAQLTAPPAATA